MIKKSKRKSLIKSVRKTIREDIKQNLLTQLKEVAGKLGQTNKKFEKEIEKGSKQLAKKLSKELKINEIELLETGNKTEVQASEPATPTRQHPNNSTSAKTVPTSKPQVKPKKVPAETV